MIELRNLCKTYKGTEYSVLALDSVSLTIADGEFVAVMGKSGSGKSTLLNCIGLIDSFDSGEYLLDGEIIKPGEKRNTILRRDKISFIFQRFELMRNYSVYENIEMPLIAKRIKQRERKQIIYDYADELTIGEILNKYPYQLSGGQQQRVAIERAIVSNNPYILADEPTGALDSKNSEMLIGLLKKINKTGKTIIMVTHDEVLAKECDRLLLIQDGRIM